MSGRADVGSRERASEAALADALSREGWAMLEDFLAPEEVTALAATAHERRLRGEFRPGGIGRGDARTRRTDLRGDSIRWLDAGEALPAERALIGRLESLREGLNRELFLGLAEVEAHFAIYPPGARYTRHVDRIRDDDARVVSVVVYLNEGWRAEDGGRLRLEPAHRGPPVGSGFEAAGVGDAAGGGVPAVEVEPLAGRAVLFLSDAVPHEVLPARRERLSVAAWFRRRP